ncbi:MAG: flagellar protein FlgN [Lachnospiraceae bacterium]|nr:flagellar protein FlgN [Lachnospiraceae bacterium]
MASLMEDLIEVLEKENSEYEKLLALSMKKTPVIIGADLEQLQKITDEEQEIVSRIHHLDRRREENMKEIARVINKDVNELTLGVLVDIFERRPKEHRQLAEIHDKLKSTMQQMVRVNEQNRELIESSLEMVQFDMNVLQAMKTAPETANYTKEAYSSGDVMGNNAGGFDAKQ